MQEKFHPENFKMESKKRQGLKIGVFVKQVVIVFGYGLVWRRAAPVEIIDFLIAGQAGKAEAAAETRKQNTAPCCPATSAQTTA